MMFQTIVADPPWQYGKAKQDDYAPGTAEREYETMTIDQIALLPIADISADDAHLYLWVTNPKLYGDRSGGMSPHDVMRSWGFTYKTMLTWVKVTSSGEVMRGGMGYYFRGATEHVLFGVRGKAPIPTQLREPNVILAPRGRHSEKPDEFFDLFERVSPSPRLELFARRARKGWATWGDQAPGSIDLHGLATNPFLNRGLTRP